MKDLVIIGAGPAGLATAVAARERGLTCLVLDQGTVADAIRRFPTFMTFFSTPEQLEIGDVPFTCATFRPTRVDAIRYYAAVVRARGLEVETHRSVRSLARTENGFTLSGRSGETWSARCVVVATGYFDSPRPFPVPGADLPFVHRAYTEPYAYAGQEVIVVGGRNSAAEAALELHRAGARVTVVHRGGGFSDGVKYWMLPDIENRIKAGEVKARFGSTVREFLDGHALVDGPEPGRIRCDAAFVLIGYVPDTSLLTDAVALLDPETLGPVHDPLTFETTVPGLYVAGSLAAGRFNNKIFIENGRMHGRPIVDSIARK